MQTRHYKKCVVSSQVAVIHAILTMAVDCIHELILKGCKVVLGDLGSFWVNFKSRGELVAADFVAANNIKKLRVRYTAGKVFSDLIGDAEFNQVPSRAIQAATLKTINGEKTPGGSTGKTETVVTISKK